MENDDAALGIEDEAIADGIIPQQIAQEIGPAGPNPLAIQETPLEQIIPQGVDEDDESFEVQGVEDQGVEDQGVENIIEDLNETFEIEDGESIDEGEESSESEDEEDREIERRRNIEKDRRSNHLYKRSNTVIYKKLRNGLPSCTTFS